MRDFDLVGRISDDTFLIVLSNCPKRQASQACERARALVESLALPLPGGSTATASIGIACSSGGPASLDAALAAAMEALAKAQSRGNACAMSAETFEAPKS